MAKESYNDLIFQLGDLARDVLPGKPNCPRSMERVYRAEEVLEARRDELAALEAEMNDEDVAYQDSLAQHEDECAAQKEITGRFKRAVDAVEGKVKGLRKTLATRRADLRYAIAGLKKLEVKLADLEMTTQDPVKLDAARQNLKKNRIAQMRLAREVEDWEAQLAASLTPTPGQPGAAGILAHKRLIELEDAAEEQKRVHDARMAELDQAIAAKEEETKGAEDYLDQALFLLGEEVYAERIAEAQLASFYPRLDRAQ
ncbi:hypothetical protein D7V97_04050 [Corallococcus sp. CA053C]|uniref:hypothetical protein n=1 Tax=Corallococcus sp. CA053C TaxID=2316732 RepID=UPI000EA037EA|nr:hypothetical protein [Corallococcus sp. CA053C]RKH14047.1 hypothetical protein D7V97_04050 [Corallococcus sp. CA053C]